MDETAMTQISKKRKNVTIAYIIIAFLAVAFISALILHDQSSQPTASPSPSLTAPPTSPSTPMSTPTPNQTPSSTPTPASGLSANVTVSGKANSAALSLPFPSSLIRIQFTDIQTGINTSFSFPDNYPPQTGIIGNNVSIQNYSVTLMNNLTYTVAITYYLGPSSTNVTEKTDYVGNFTVYASAGKTAISKDFT